MLLRAGFLYIFGVASLLLGVLAAWQGLQLANLKDGVVTLAEHTARMERDLDAARLEAEAAQRQALVAEDKLARATISPATARGSEEPGGAGSTAASAEVETLQRDLADVQRERDAARTEAYELAGELVAARGAGERSDVDKDLEAAREQINKLSDELEEARRSLIQAQSARDERDALSAQHASDRDVARADVQKLSGELEIARAEVLRLSGELEAANKTLAAHHAASDVGDAQAGGAARAMQAGTGSLGVTAAPSAPIPAAVIPAPMQTPAKAASLEPAPQEGSEGLPASTTSATGDAASTAPKTPAPKRKEAKRKKRSSPRYHIESSIFLPF